MSRSKRPPYGRSPASRYPPTMETNSKGYEYLRDESGGDDSTIYVHQLLACVDHDPREVFADHTFVSRHLPIPWLNVPENVSLIPKWDLPPERLWPDDVLDRP